MTTVYWLENPKILFDKGSITELWPTSSMTYIEKMNTLSRLIVFLTIIGMIVFRSLNILIIGLIVLCVLTYLYNKKIINEKGKELYDSTSYNNDKKENKKTNKDTKENFETMLPWKNNEVVLSNDKPIYNKNPLNNHLVSDSIGAESKVKKTNNKINNTVLLDTIRNNASNISDIKLNDDLDTSVNLDRHSMRYYKIPTYDKSTLQYLTGNSATVKDNIFIKKNEKFIK